MSRSNSAKTESIPNIANLQLYRYQHINLILDTDKLTSFSRSSSAIQYVIGTDPIPNIGGIINSKEFDKYKAVHPEAKPLKYGPEMKRQWRKTLDEVVVPLDDELR
jgi:hypothetical protein